jgi:hypothetical protein
MLEKTYPKDNGLNKSTVLGSDTLLARHDPRSNHASSAIALRISQGLAAERHLLNHITMCKHVSYRINCLDVCHVSGG